MVTPRQQTKYDDAISTAFKAIENIARYTNNYDIRQAVQNMRQTLSDIQSLDLQDNLRPGKAYEESGMTYQD